MEKVTCRGLDAVTDSRSGETNRSGSSGDSGGDEHRRRLQQGSDDDDKSRVSLEEKLSKERFRITSIASSATVFTAETVPCTACCAVWPRAFSRVLRRTSTFSVSSLRENEKDFRTKHGAPGPPNRMRAPRRTL